MRKKLVSVFASFGFGVLGSFSLAQIANSQTSSNYLEVGEQTSFQASRPNSQWNYTRWTFCFGSASRNNRNARVDVYALGGRKRYWYTTNGQQKCLNYYPTGDTWVVTNTGNTPIDFSITPSYQ